MAKREQWKLMGYETERVWKQFRIEQLLNVSSFDNETELNDYLDSIFTSHEMLSRFKEKGRTELRNEALNWWRDEFAVIEAGKKFEEEKRRKEAKEREGVTIEVSGIAEKIVVPRGKGVKIEVPRVGVEPIVPELYEVPEVAPEEITAPETLSRDVKASIEDAKARVEVAAKAGFTDRVTRTVVGVANRVKDITSRVTNRIKSLFR